MLLSLEGGCHAVRKQLAADMIALEMNRTGALCPIDVETCNRL